MNRKALIIEDDAVSRHLLKTTLAKEGWEVIEAIDGQTGLDLMEEHRAAVVICDLHIPVLNGFHVCRRIRENPQFAKTRIIVTTISRYTGDNRTALDSGADAYLTKPVNIPALLSLLPDSPGHEPNREFRSRMVTRSPFASQSTMVKFWGVRGSIPVPGPTTVRYGGNTTCIEVRVGEDLFIVDAGTGIRGLGQDIMKNKRSEPLEINLFITHTHWDHIQGLPFFTPAYVTPNQVNIYGFSGAVQSLRHTVLEQMKSVYFPVNPSDLAIVSFHELKQTHFVIGDAKIRTFFTNHPGICIAYRFETPRGDIVCLADHEVNETQYRHTKGTSEDDLLYAREQDRKIEEFARGADILIADAQFDATEYPGRVGWGHSCIDDIVKFAHRAEVGRLVFTHHAPEHSDDKLDSMLLNARKLAEEMGSTLTIDAAVEGAAYVLEKGE
ncbi:MAG: response regulator [Verrucomicrobiota bacterium]|nr:response regulator [Verrucomicrobiota bacterium]